MEDLEVLVVQMVQMAVLLEVVVIMVVVEAAAILVGSHIHNPAEKV